MSCTTGVAKKEVETGGSTLINFLPFLSIVYPLSICRRKPSHWHFLICLYEGGECSKGQIELVLSTL